MNGYFHSLFSICWTRQEIKIIYYYYFTRSWFFSPWSAGPGSDVDDVSEFKSVRKNTPSEQSTTLPSCFYPPYHHHHYILHHDIPKPIVIIIVIIITIIIRVWNRNHFMNACMGHAVCSELQSTSFSPQNKQKVKSINLQCLLLLPCTLSTKFIYNLFLCIFFLYPFTNLHVCFLARFYHFIQLTHTTITSIHAAYASSVVPTDSITLFVLE